MSVAGNSFEQTIGMVTAGTEIMVGQPAKVGRGLRTIAINISKLAQGQSELSVANGKYTVSLQDQEGQMRSTYDIMNDLGNIWGNLNETEQTALATQLAGKTQFEVFSNVMKNWESAVRATTTAQDAQGSSLRENERYLDSIEGKLQNFQSAWEQLSYHVVNSDMIKGFIDFGTTAITAIDKVVQKIGALPTAIGMLGTALGGLKLFKIARDFVSIGTAVDSAGQIIKSSSKLFSLGAKELTTWISTGSILATNIPLIAGAVAGLGAAFAIANEQYKQSFRGRLDEYHAIGDEIQGIQDEIDALSSKEGELTSEEKTRLGILKTQLSILKEQEALRLKEATEAYNKEAEKKFSKKPGLASDSQYMVGDKYLTVLQKEMDIRQKIQHLNDEARQHPLTKEQQKEFEELNKVLEETQKARQSWLDNLVKEHELLADLDYNQLDEEGKAYFDNTHSAYLQAATDVQEVRDGIANTIDLFGSAQFDSWNIDVSSLKSASDLADQITTKISEMGDDEEVVIYARDEAGNIIDEITKKKGELTNDEWELVVDATTTGNYDKLQEYIDEHPDREEVLIEFKETGAKNVEEQKKKAAENETAYVDVKDRGAERVKKTVADASQNQNAIINLEEKGSQQVKKTKDDLAKNKTSTINIVQSGASAVWSWIQKLTTPRSTTITVNTTQRATGKRKGEKGGLSWLGDEGTAQNPKPELVVGDDGAYLAGTTGWEMRQLKSTDTVYTHAQTKKLLGGKQSFAGTVTPLPMYKKGKKAKKKKASGTAKDQYDAALKAYNKAKKGKNKKKKKSTKKALDKAKKALDKKRSQFDSDLDTLEYRREVEDWTEARFQEEYANLVNRYGNNLSTEQRRAFDEERDKYQDKLARDEAERVVSLIGVGAKTAASAVSEINAAQHLTADEKKDYRAQAYKASVEYNLKEYQNGKKTRDQILADIKNYYNTRGTYDDEYYKMLDDLREADKKKELERLDELKDREENKLSYLKKYAQRQRDYYDEQIDKEKEEADELEKLVDLQEKLNNAKKTMVKVYREGVGFVYEQDTKAIREAQKALDDYNKEHAKSDLEQQVNEWQKIVDLIDDLEDLSDMKELELKLGIGGITDLTGGDIGTDIAKWTELIKNILSTMQGYEEISKILDKATGADIENLIGSTLSVGDKRIADTILSQYFARHSFASGSLSTPSGFSLLGESGPEIGWLNKGSSVFSNAISKNLMEWGQYSPAQVLENALGSMQNQVFNFDKIVLPNVRNAEEFYRELQLLPNKAIQQSASRI